MNSSQVKFSIDTTYANKPKMVDVVVYDTVDQLRRAASSYSGIDAHDVVGICHPLEIYQYHTDGRDATLQPLSAVVRYCRPYSGIGVVTHEMTHAAVSIHEVETNGRALIAGDDEEFAWTLGDLVRKTVGAFYEKQIWSNE